MRFKCGQKFNTRKMVGQTSIYVLLNGCVDFKKNMQSYLSISNFINRLFTTMKVRISNSCQSFRIKHNNSLNIDPRFSKSLETMLHFGGALPCDMYM